MNTSVCVLVQTELRLPLGPLRRIPCARPYNALASRRAFASQRMKETVLQGIASLRLRAAHPHKRNPGSSQHFLRVGRFSFFSPICLAPIFSAIYSSTNNADTVIGFIGFK